MEIEKKLDRLMEKMEGIRKEMRENNDRLSTTEDKVKKDLDEISGRQEKRRKGTTVCKIHKKK